MSANMQDPDPETEEMFRRSFWPVIAILLVIILGLFMVGRLT